MLRFSVRNSLIRWTRVPINGELARNPMYEVHANPATRGKYGALSLPTEGRVAIVNPRSCHVSFYPAIGVVVDRLEIILRTQTPVPHHLRVIIAMTVACRRRMWGRRRIMSLRKLIQVIKMIPSIGIGHLRRGTFPRDRIQQHYQI